MVICGSMRPLTAPTVFAKLRCAALIARTPNMKTRSKWLLALLSMPLAWALLVLGLRALGPTREQADAVTLLRAPSPVIERNAFAALWLLAYDVPAGDLAGVAARDTAAFNALAPEQRAQFQSLASARYRKLTVPMADQLVCDADATACLRSVRADRDRADAVVQTHAELLGRIEALEQYDGEHSGFAPSLQAPLVFGTYMGRLPLVAAAVQFANGDSAPALDRVCRLAGTSRRLSNNSDSLIARLVTANWFTEAANVAAVFLAEIPRDVPLPESCVLAFAAPTTDDVDLCEAMKYEWQYSNSIIEQVQTAPRQTNENVIEYPARRIGYFFIFDADASRAQQARQLSRYCDTRSHAALADIRESAAPTATLQCPLRDWAHNFAGCVLTQISASAYDKYALRLRDHAAHIRLMGALLWWRAQSGDGEPARTPLQRLPEEFHSQTRPVELADQGRALRIRRYETGRDAYWQVPLPASRLPVP